MSVDLQTLEQYNNGWRELGMTIDVRLKHVKLNISYPTIFLNMHEIFATSCIFMTWGWLFLLGQHAGLEIFSTNSLKQHSEIRHVSVFWHIILIMNQQNFTLSPKCYMINVEAAHINFIVVGFSWPEIQPTICCTLGKHTNWYTAEEIQ